MATSMKWTVLVALCVTCIVTVNATNSTNANGTIAVTAVQLSNDTAFGVCLYPTSGSYSFLNRLLYYCTLVFSLFSRAHLWLVAGALAAALTYSGAAAVHACLLAWRGPNPFAEMDAWALDTILSTACLITVPLLSWSGTLRRLGAKFAIKNDEDALKTQSSVGTRSIVVYWGFLVFVGYVSAWSAIWYGDGNWEECYPDMAQVFCRPGTNASMFASAGGGFHKRAIDQAFIIENKCNDPCATITVPSIFRQKGDLVLLDHQRALLFDLTLTSSKYDELNKFINIQDVFMTINEFMLMFILLQGFITVCFGRRDPREIRDLIYIKLALDHPLSDKPILITIQDYVVRVLAFLSYLMAVAMIVICPPLLILIVLNQEWSTQYQIPDAEPMSSVGQWGPWAITVEILLATLISRYHDSMVEKIAESGRYVLDKIRGRPTNQTYQEIRLQAHKAHTAVDPTDVEAATDTKTDESVVTTKDKKPLSEPTPEKSRSARFKSFLYNCYTTCASPINRNGEGLIDELRNFISWCRNPVGTSKIVVRHPIRRKEEEAEIDETVSVGGDSEVDRSQTRRGSGFFRAASKANKGPSNANRRSDRGKREVKTGPMT